MIDPEHVLAILNGAFPRRSKKLRLLSDVQRYLRPWLDEWIDSGRKRDGSENPRARTYGSEAASSAALSFFDSMAITLPRGRSNPEVEWLWGGGAEQEARRVFVLTLASEWRFRLAKCRYCGIYFSLESGRNFEYGIACPKHRRMLAARESTNRRRKNNRTTVLSWVAAEISRAGDLEVWDEAGRFSAEALKPLNDKISELPRAQRSRLGYPLTTNFLTRNRVALRKLLRARRRSR